MSRLARRRIINDTSIRSIKPPAAAAVDYFDDLTPGLSLRVTAEDVRTWTVFYRDQHARQKRQRLGRYPAVKLVDARELARNAQRRVAQGGDPVIEKRAAREALTFGELARTYIGDYAKLNKKSWAEDQRQLDADLLPKWKGRPAAEISAEDLLTILNAKVRDGSPVAANRLRALVSRIFTFGVEQRLVAPAANPVIGVKKPTKETSRDRVLTHEEIRRIWDACDTQNPYVSAWFRLRLVTAQRGGELLQMRWQDIDEQSHAFDRRSHGDGGAGGCLRAGTTRGQDGSADGAPARVTSDLWRPAGRQRSLANRPASRRRDARRPFTASTRQRRRSVHPACHCRDV